MQRVLVCQPGPPAGTDLGSVLEGQGFEVSLCGEGQVLLEEVVNRLPDVVVYRVPSDGVQDVGVLRLLRRAAPELPLVIVVAEDTLFTRRLMQDLRPIYCSVSPVDEGELREVVHDALTRGSRSTRAGRA